MPKHGGRGWYDIVDSIPNGVGFLSMIMPCSQEKGENVVQR